MTSFVRPRTLGLLLLLLLPVAGIAQTDQFGKVDTVYADLAKLNDHTYTITVSFTNDENVVALSVPLKMTAGLTRVVADSAIYTGGRVENFAIKAFRCDTAIQCITLGMIANVGPAKVRISPGAGRLVTVYVSAVDQQAIEKFAVDTTTTYPNNSLMVIADSLQGTGEDTTRVGRDKIEIIPVFVVRQQ